MEPVAKESNIFLEGFKIPISHIENTAFFLNTWKKPCLYVVKKTSL